MAGGDSVITDVNLLNLHVNMQIACTLYSPVEWGQVRFEQVPSVVIGGVPGKGTVNL